MTETQHRTDIPEIALRGASTSAANQFIILAGTFVFVACFELLFKSPIIFSQALFLDDIFYFERSLSGLTFNGLDASPADIPAGLGSDYTPNLRLYRALASTLGSIIPLRIVHLAVFCMVAGLLALNLLPLLKDRLLAGLTASFACLTPFSHIMTIFANGTYFAWFFLFYLSALLAFRNVSFGEKDSWRRCIFLVIGSASSVLAASIVDSGILLLWPLLAFLAWNGRAWASKTGLAVTGTLTLLLAAFSWHTISSIQHPYAAMADRLHYSLPNMMYSGLIILSNMVADYMEPMQYTGFRLQRENVYPALALVAVLIAFAIWARQLILRGWVFQGGALPALSFFLTSTIISIGPYSIQTVTHIWHYYPHMLFFVPSVILLFVLTVNRWAGYAVILVCAAFTVSTYIKTMPNYRTSVAREAKISDFLAAQKDEIQNSMSVVVLTDTRELASGLMNTDRFTSFARYTLKDPFLAQIEVFHLPAKPRRKADPLPDLAGTTVITMRDEFRTISIDGTKN